MPALIPSVGSGASAENAASVTATFPAGSFGTDDLFVVVVQKDGTITTPSGWPALGTALSTVTDQWVVRGFYRFAAPGGGGGGRRQDGGVPRVIIGLLCAVQYGRHELGVNSAFIGTWHRVEHHG